MKRVSVKADDLVDLIDAYDQWGGTMLPEDADEYRERFKALRERAEKAVAASAQQPTQPAEAGG